MNNILLNFQSSYSGGGLKRLVEFSRYFDRIGGATFVVHPDAIMYLNNFKNNKYIIEYPSRLRRFFNINSRNTCNVLRESKWDIYYAYGIPISSKVVANKIIMHVSNVLPFLMGRFFYDLLDWFKFKIIFLQMLGSFSRCTHVAAESEYSLSLIRRWHHCEEIYSQNGSDDELSIDFRNVDFKSKNAIILGTHLHKNLLCALNVFDEIKLYSPSAKLYVIGSEKAIPTQFFGRSDVIVLGVKDRASVIDLLSGAYYYISTTLVENSFNAASEGIYFAEESYISDIPPHRELLKGVKVHPIQIKNGCIPMLKVFRKDLTFDNLKTWNQVAENIFGVN